MSYHSLLFPELEQDSPAPRSTGVFPSQKIQEFIDSGRIHAPTPIAEAQIQPASLDLRLGPVAYRVRASFLPGKSSTVEEKIRELGMNEMDLRAGAVFEKRCVYVVPLVEEWYLPDDISGKSNPKSTTGRLDIFTRLITDYGTEFERVAQGYKGKLYAEVVPRTFTVAVREGMRLNQVRFVRGSPPPLRESATLTKLHEQEPLAYTADDSPADPEIRHGLPISIDLAGGPGAAVVGFKAKSHAPLIDLAKVNFYDPEEFWDPIPSSKKIILDPNDFYILVSKEKVSVRPDLAGEMVAYDPAVGEFRIHYAGFFDPGFGYGLDQGKGTRAVLEVRSHEVPFVIEDGQLVGRLVFERLTDVPHKIYGVGIGSSYQAQGLSLSKQFRRGP
ncbi:MAG: 2'-deoxycytidine 5'-triphosphate deaminase [Acidobacteria bacterium RIFCSPLOWO2_02_FULL_61_28]|nr:MAG: 2'-deoxycytidine 5'-triphosphate deaminase [Acidobacteria bacterium RIFCSPLOWO2_02_FULL_61_28]